MEFTLLAAAGFAVFGFWGTLRWEAKRGNASRCAVDLFDAGLMAAVAGVAAGRLVAMVSAGINPLTSPGQVILVRSGISTSAATLATLAVFAVIARKDLVAAADGIAPAALAGLAGWHAGCLPTGSCLGTESSLPWAVALEGSSVTRHPVEIYTALALAAAALALAFWKQHGRPPLGAPAGIALATAGGVRLATEPLRISLDGGPWLLYVAGMVVGVAVTAVAFLGKPVAFRR